MNNLSERLASLSPEKLACISEKLREQGKKSIDRPAIPRRLTLGPCPLSFAQRRLWFLQQMAPNSPFYHINSAARLTGALDLGALERALQEVTARHEILRTTFHSEEGEPIQRINPAPPIGICVADLTQLYESSQEELIADLARLHGMRTFDLAQGPLVRLSLLRMNEEDHILLLTLHHIIMDGWSVGLLVKEMITLYSGDVSGERVNLPSPLLQYADYASWQRGWLRGETLERELTYWRRQLADAPPLLEAPADRPRRAVPTYRGGVQPVRLGLEVLGNLRNLCQGTAASMFMVTLAGFKVLLSKYTGRKDILVGTPIAYREREELVGVLGLLLNTIVIRTNLGGDPSFEEVVRRVRSVTMEALTHQDAPFEKLVEELGKERDASFNPIFQIWFVMQKIEESGADALRRLSVRPMELKTETTLFDLMLDLKEGKDELVGCFRYSSDLYEQSTIYRMARRFERLMTGVANEPGKSISEIELTTETERNDIRDWLRDDLETTINF